jgi:hypothetical protein
MGSVKNRRFADDIAMFFAKLSGILQKRGLFFAQALSHFGHAALVARRIEFGEAIYRFVDVLG